MASSSDPERGTDEEIVINDLTRQELIELRDELRHHRAWINRRLGSIKKEFERRQEDSEK